MITFILILSHLGATVKDYLASFGKESPSERQDCHVCGRKMHRHGCFRRWLWSRRGPVLIPIYRQLCPGCRVTVSLFPAFIKPWQRLCLCDLEWVLDQYVGGAPIEQLAEEAGVDPLSLRRWLRRLSQRALDHCLWMAREVLLIQAGPDPTRGALRNRRDILNSFLRMARQLYAVRSGQPPPPGRSLLVFNLIANGSW